MEEAERVAQLLSAQHSDPSKLEELEARLNACIEQAEDFSQDLQHTKAEARVKQGELEQLERKADKRREEVEAMEQDAATKNKELPVIVAAMEATAGVLAQADAEFKSKAAALKQLEQEIHERLEANAEAIKFTKSSKAATEKKARSPAPAKRRVFIRRAMSATAVL